jgi:hypothetical protein
MGGVACPLAGPLARRRLDPAQSSAASSHIVTEAEILVEMLARIPE